MILKAVDVFYFIYSNVDLIFMIISVPIPISEFIIISEFINLVSYFQTNNGRFIPWGLNSFYQFTFPYKLKTFFNFSLGIPHPLS